MYAKFFGLNQDPFSIAPDPRYLFMSERHREALAHLLYGLGGGGGFVLLSGEIGTGKTTVCRCFLEQIPADCNVAYIFNPKLSVTELLRSICDEFHIALPQNAVTARDFIDPLNGFLLREHAAGKNNVLIIDEAQNLSADVLEQLRLLTNLETNERKLLQIVLIGQPELRRMLARPELEQLAQRVIARFHLDALSATETTHYIAHRLAVAGMKGEPPFDSKALTRVHKLSRGVPRRINLLCGRALLGAYANGKARVDRATVDKAATEVFGPDLKSDPGADVSQTQKPPPSQTGYRSTSAIALASMTGLLLGAAILGAGMWLMQSKASTDKTAIDKTASSKATAGKAATEKLLLAPAASASSPLVPDRAASAPASTNLASPTAAVLSRNDFSARLTANTTNQNQAWQALGQAWGLKLDDGDACQAALQQRVYCYSGKQTPLSLIRELNRPGIVTLLDANKRPAYLVLSGLSVDTATLGLGSQTYTVSLAVLADSWRGDFATLRRAPESYVEKTYNGRARPATEWLSAQLAKIPGTTPGAGAPEAGTSPEAALRARIYAFQLAHGLAPDGQAGPITLMQLNRATGVNEPLLT
ncbi:MAG: AAA family ATPase, partial [Polaromonas sp.]|nr:AAA family ATPase [Polaromonas sp.]